MNQSTQRIIGNKLGLLNLAEELGNVSKACQMMGVSRDTFYRYKSAKEEGGVDALLDQNRRKPNPKKLRAVSAMIMAGKASVVAAIIWLRNEGTMWRKIMRN